MVVEPEATDPQNGVRPTISRSGPKSSFSRPLRRAVEVLSRGVQRGHLAGDPLSSRAISDTKLNLPIIGPCLGRGADLAALVEAIQRSRKEGSDTARVVIVGGAGIGKTSLAAALVHDAVVKKVFKGRRYWVDLESRDSVADFTRAIAAALPISPDSSLDASIDYLASAPALLCLDDLDALAGPDSIRTFLADALDRLGSVCCLAVTLRDARPLPMQTTWTRTIRLERLDAAAAADTFCLVADTFRDDPDLKALIRDCDGLPIAIRLLSRLATVGLPLSDLRKQWAEERSQLLSQGLSRHDNLAISLNLSLSHPSLVKNEDAWNVLRVLAPLPEGCSLNGLRALLFQTCVSVGLAVLLSLGVVAMDRAGRYSLLAPIRECVIDTIYCPSAWMVRQAQKLLPRRSAIPWLDFELLNFHLTPPGTVLLSWVWPDVDTSVTSSPDDDAAWLTDRTAGFLSDVFPPIFVWGRGRYAVNPIYWSSDRPPLSSLHQALSRSFWHNSADGRADYDSRSLRIAKSPRPDHPSAGRDFTLHALPTGYQEGVYPLRFPGFPSDSGLALYHPEALAAPLRIANGATF